MPSTPDKSIKKAETRLSKSLKLILKLVVTAVCFWYISTKIDFTKAFEALKTAKWLLLALAVIIYLVSKFIAAYRLNLYFKNINLHLSQWKNLNLYWAGMFYNLFLPGSISGDAYKVVLLNKKLKASYKSTGAAVLLDRFSGVLGLGILLCVYGVMVLDDNWFDVLLIGGCALALLIFYIVIRKFFKEFLASFWTTLMLGLVVQTVQVIGVYFILSAINISMNQQEWIFIFLTASVVSVLPISLGGGLGTREVIFAEGATFFGLDPHLGVIVSLLFYLSSVVGSLPGAYFIFYDPLVDMVAQENKGEIKTLP